MSQRRCVVYDRSPVVGRSGHRAQGGDYRGKEVSGRHSPSLFEPDGPTLTPESIECDAVRFR